jgi:hypothetical protein
MVRGHAPSTDARDKVNHWLLNEKMVSIQRITIEGNQQLLDSKKKYKYDDLPCLIVDRPNDKRGRRDTYYGDEIEEIARGIHENYHRG